LFYKLYEKIRLFAPSYHARSHLLILKFVNIESCNIILHKLNRKNLISCYCIIDKYLVKNMLNKKINKNV